MKVNYLGASLRVGISARDNSPYQIGEILFSIPDKNGEKKDPDGKTRWNYKGYGHTTRTIGLDPGKIELFKDCEAGTEVDLIVEPVPSNPSRNQVIGFKA